MAGASPSSRQANLQPKKVTYAVFLATMVAFLAAASLLSLTPRITPLPGTLAHLPPQHSFVRSLNHFLATRAPARPTSASMDATPPMPHDIATKALARNLDLAMSLRDSHTIDPPSPLKVYVYDMPSKFTYDLLWLFHDTYDQTGNMTSNGSPVHRLIEQHSVDYWLWADLLAPEPQRLVKSVIRVHDQAEADVFYIPFFTTISFFLLEKAQRKSLYREALNWIRSQPAWQRSGGRDHVLPVHHPWSFKSVRRFMKHAIWLLPDLDSSGHWYKPGEVYLEKDVVLPYVPNVDACDNLCSSHYLPLRKTLLFFRGRTKRNAGGKIRSKLIAILQHEAGVSIEEGSIGSEGKAAAQAGMRRSVFCLNPAGDTPSSARLFDAIVSGCIPVIISDELELPFEGFLDYRKIALFVSSSQAVQPGWLMAELRTISSQQIAEMQFHLAEFSKHFKYASPSQPLGPEDLTWRMIAAKVQMVKLHIRRTQRLVEGSRDSCFCDCRANNISSFQPLLRTPY